MQNKTGMIIKKNNKYIKEIGAQSNNINYMCYSNIYEWHIKSSMVKKKVF